MSWNSSKYSLIIDPYDSFMKKHLEHYGYFTGRNMTIARFGFEPKHSAKTNDSDESDTTSGDSDGENSVNKVKARIEFKNFNKQNKLSDNYKWWLKDNIYSITQKELEFQREPRWPIEMQVLPDKIKHIYTIPVEPEPFYAKTGLEETPMCRTDLKSRTVFYYNPTNCGYFVRSRVGGNKEELQKYCHDLSDIEMATSLLFESRFESGNLMKAIKISDTEYELYLRYDMYTKKHTQWFYFQVKNAKPGVEYRFTICNFFKTDSLYNMGMRPLIYSELDAKNKNIGWRRTGSNIKYYRNNLKCEDENGNVKSFYSLTWTCTFPNDNDTYYFAHCYPYTYSDLQDYIKNVQDDPLRSKHCKVKILCRSLAENLVHLLTITNFSNTEEENKNKKAVVLTARVHPGETNSSWMMKGFLDFLLGNTSDAKLLRDTFIFKIVPMLNPDGVIIGNYRCSLTGRDLNRNYKTLLKEAFPSVWHTREMIKKLLDEREVILYCDLHGHSRKNNIFIYGCHNNNKPPERRFKEHVFPMMMSKNAKDLFSYKSCKFKIQKSKQGTGRIVMWNLGILNSFTLEATFNGSSLNQKSGFHFNTRDLEQLAYFFCDSLLDYCDPDQTKCKMILNEVEKLMKEQIRSRLESQGINVDQINLIEDLDKLNINLDDDEQESSDDAGSDSSADDGLPLHLERFAKIRQRKKRKVKSRKANPTMVNSSSQQNLKTPAKEQIINKLNTTKTGNNSNHNLINLLLNQSTNASSYNDSNLTVKNATNINNNNNTKVNILNSNSEKEKKEKSSTNSAGILYLSTKQSNDTLVKLHNKHRYLMETEKKLLKPLITNNSSIQLNQIPQHPKSAKVLYSNGSLGNFQVDQQRDEKLYKRDKQNAIQLQLDTESAPYQDPNFLTFKYTIPTEIQLPGNFYSQGHLCEHHRKKLSDLILLRRVNPEEKTESDGEASDDEGDPTNEETGAKNRVVFEDYVRKHNLTKRDPTKQQRKASRVKGNSLINNPNKPVRTYYEPLLEIRSIAQSHSPKTEAVNETRSDQKTAIDYMPKYVLKQLNERRLVNPTTVTNPSNNNPNNNILPNNNITTVMTPYGLYNSKNSYDYVETITKELNRKSGRSSSKLQSQLYQSTQDQQQQPTQPAKMHISSSSSSLVSQHQSQHPQSLQNLRPHQRLANLSLMNHNNYNDSDSASSSNNPPASLFSTAFLNATQKSNQSDKTTITSTKTSPPLQPPTTTTNTNSMVLVKQKIPK